MMRSPQDTMIKMQKERLKSECDSRSNE